jgi:CxxC motif-containing protein
MEDKTVVTNSVTVADTVRKVRTVRTEERMPKVGYIKYWVE